METEGRAAGGRAAAAHLVELSTHLRSEGREETSTELRNWLQNSFVPTYLGTIGFVAAKISILRKNRLYK